MQHHGMGIAGDGRTRTHTQIHTNTHAHKHAWTHHAADVVAVPLQAAHQAAGLDVPHAGQRVPRDCHGARAVARDHGVVHPRCTGQPWEVHGDDVTQTGALMINLR